MSVPEVSLQQLKNEGVVVETEGLRARMKGLMKNSKHIAILIRTTNFSKDIFIQFRVYYGSNLLEKTSARRISQLE